MAKLSLCCLSYVSIEDENSEICPHCKKPCIDFVTEDEIEQEIPKRKHTKSESYFFNYREPNGDRINDRER